MVIGRQSAARRATRWRVVDSIDGYNLVLGPQPASGAVERVAALVPYGLTHVDCVSQGFAEGALGGDLDLVEV